MDPTYVQYIGRLIFALFIGGLIGIEREIKGKPAGMRTNMLMCMGSCLLMILSIEVFLEGVGMGDPSRIASQVVVGIGFLGAGMIIQSRFSVAGLTSAATLWFVAAIGLVVGWGEYVLASASTILIIITLTLLDKIEQLVAVKQRRHILQFRVPADTSSMRAVKEIFKDSRLTPDNLAFQRSEQHILVDVDYAVPDNVHQTIVEALRGIESIDILLDY